jgi:GT2 family glycosyltransferase
MAQTLCADRDLDMVYSDEDKLTPDGRHVDPFFKPDWSPDYFLSCMYTCHLGVYRTALVRALGGFRPEFDTAQDYDLVLRLITRTRRIAHVSDILYHWRMLPTSTASGAKAKPAAHEVARRALQAYLEAMQRPGRVEPGPVQGFHRVRFDILGEPLVSIVIPTGCKPVRLRGQDTTYLAACIASIRGCSSYRNYEIVTIDNQDMPLELQRQLDAWGVRRLSWTGEFNLAAKINLGAEEARGDYLLLLNDDIEVITPDWLESMLEFAQQPEVGAVGAKLLFPSGRIQHAGVTVLDGNPGHPFYSARNDHPGYFCSNIALRNWSAVTGACLMTRARVFREAGGFDERFPLNYNDVDFCLRLGSAGLRVVCTPYAQLYHHEAVTKSGVHAEELERFKARWGERWGRDPYYNPNLSTQAGDFRIAVP